MNEPMMDYVLRQLHDFVEQAYAKSQMEDEDKQERLIHQGNLALGIRETISQFEVDEGQIRFGVVLLVMVYLSAMQDASVCKESQKIADFEERMKHQVEHMAASIQDYVMAVAQFPEAEVTT